MLTRTSGARACTYCSTTDPEADACVRTQRHEDGGAHIYAHKECAEEAGVNPFYEFTEVDAQAVRS
ncbi:hypothetical protein ACIRQY_33640 [Streptomyces sp. NPDC101490]|uniref:hypothetical protein n=1 Tax=Streptomyces sp. NPDC101490 TaxID=3366143 RepID=UPI00381577D6